MRTTRSPGGGGGGGGGGGREGGCVSYITGCQRLCQKMIRMCDIRRIALFDAPMTSPVWCNSYHFELKVGFKDKCVSN